MIEEALNGTISIKFIIDVATQRQFQVSLTARHSADQIGIAACKHCVAAFRVVTCEWDTHNHTQQYHGYDPCWGSLRCTVTHTFYPWGH